MNPQMYSQVRGSIKNVRRPDGKKHCFGPLGLNTNVRKFKLDQSSSEYNQEFSPSPSGILSDISKSRSALSNPDSSADDEYDNAYDGDFSSR